MMHICTEDSRQMTIILILEMFTTLHCTLTAVKLSIFYLAVTHIAAYMYVLDSLQNNA